MKEVTNPAAASLIGWLRVQLFPAPLGVVATLAILYFAWRIVPPLVDWALIRAVWSADDPAQCRAMMGQGACWAFVADKYRFILFGTFPADEQWRPALVIAILIGLYGVSAPRYLRGVGLGMVWLVGLVSIGVLMWGGFLGLSYVETERWGGLTLTLLLSTFGLAVAFPLAILLALARRSGLPVLRWLAIAYIELIRGVPLVSLLFMASVMLPLFLPAGVSIDKLLRAQVAMIGFAAAYLAEVVRGGMQAIPRQQEEAAQALGLGYWQRTRFVILPQALRISIPPLINTFIGFFKDTSLVLVIGLFDFLTTLKVALSEPAWSGFGVEAYLFAAAGYFLFCYPMSRYSRMLEHRAAPGRGIQNLREN
ncbi:MAG TPA: amino acid ABC transporter permease [Candidatus Binatia bacterium]|nr:amino acid ABC transporter permease [Candidatus Binatia bacterium]